MESKQEIRSALRKSFSDVIYTLFEMSDTQFFHPRGTNQDQWSPAEILGHLILSAKSVSKAMSLPKLALRATFGIKKGGETTFEETINQYQKVLKEGMQAPSSYRYSNPKEKGRQALMDSWSKELDKLLTQVKKWSEADLDKYQLPHPALGKLSIRDILLFTDYHNKHHHEQMKEVFSSLST